MRSLPLVVLSSCLVMLYSVLAVADFYARKRGKSSIHDSIRAVALSPDIQHKVRLVDALLEFAAKSKSRKQKALAISTAAKVAEIAVRQHPADPRAWSLLWACRLAQGRRYAAYAAISRTIALDPLFGPNLLSHMKTAEIVGDKIGLRESARRLGY